MEQTIELVGTNDLERHMWLESLLRQGVYEIAFTKLDGSTRTIKCTLKAELLPKISLSEIRLDKPKFLKLETMSAWVPDIEQWRSFRVMNILAIKEV